jgi:argininosuccinate lyase
MSTKEQVEAAKQRMDAAHRALLAYVTRLPSEPPDDELHKRLGHEFKNAHHEYGRLVAELE